MFSYYRELTADDYHILSEKIVELFPSELKTIYYSPQVSRKNSPTGKVQKPKGKLFYKAQNLKKLPKELSRLHQAAPEDVLGNLEEEDPEELERLQPSIEWLENYEEPWQTAVDHWTLTSAYRRKKIGEDKSKLISQIYEDWPILKTPKAYELIEVDYRLGGYGEGIEAIQNFQNFFQKFVDVKKPKHSHEYVAALQDLLLEEDLNESKFVFDKW